MAQIFVDVAQSMEEIVYSDQQIISNSKQQATATQKIIRNLNITRKKTDCFRS